MSQIKSLFILGGAGFIGRQLITEAIREGWRVHALVRSKEAAVVAAGLGAEPVIGDALQPHTWLANVPGAAFIVDLIQPKLPKRLGARAIRAISRYRQQVTAAITDAVKSLPPGQRPLLASISGVDDLEPDARGIISPRSPLRKTPVGFAHIGIPVRLMIERSGLDALYVYLGTVYGAGKGFADTLLPRLAKGRMPIIGTGRNHLPIVHVVDAARALMHIFTQPRRLLVGHSFIVADGTATTQKELLETTARLLAARRPRHIPEWLASLLAGRALVETVCSDLRTDIAALRDTGFRFTYASIREGMPATLLALGYGQQAHISNKTSGALSPGRLS